MNTHDTNPTLTSARSLCAAVVILDISGYTRFVKHKMAARVHAEYLVAQLLEAVLDTVGEPLTVNKIEGDAVLFYAPLDAGGSGVALAIWDQIRRGFEAFRERRDSMSSLNACHCSACGQLDGLRLKAVADCGEVVRHRLKHFEELAGEPLLVTHRLLKNSLAARQYALVTESFCELSPDGPWSSGAPHVEKDRELGAIRTRVVPLDPAVKGEAAGPVPKRAYPLRVVHSMAMNLTSFVGYGIERVLPTRRKVFHNLPT